jgi:PIN domain nuclease of toxin-antitoxin system
LIVLDAFAVVAYFRDEPAAPEVVPLLDAGARLTAVGLAEVLEVLVRTIGVDEETAALDVAELGLFETTHVDSRLGLAAGRLRARVYHRTRCAVSMADCIAAEAARELDQTLASADPHLLAVCHTEGIDTIVLPASDGSRWAPP